MYLYTSCRQAWVILTYYYIQNVISKTRWNSYYLSVYIHTCINEIQHKQKSRHLGSRNFWNILGLIQPHPHCPYPCCWCSSTSASVPVSIFVTTTAEHLPVYLKPSQVRLSNWLDSYDYTGELSRAIYILNLCQVAGSGSPL